MVAKACRKQYMNWRMHQGIEIAWGENNMVAGLQFFVALGANIPSSVGDPVITFDTALTLMERKGIEIMHKSQYYETPCFPAGAGPNYVNAVVVARMGPDEGHDDGPDEKSAFGAADVLGILHEIENQMGRERSKRWGQRTLDLDLLAMGDAILPNLNTYRKWRDLSVDKQAKTAPKELILPHPRLQDRGFVLIPLNEVARDWVHPVSGLSVAIMCEKLPKSVRNEVTPL